MFKENITNEEINELPLLQFEGNIIITGDLEKQNEMAGKLLKSKVLGFDTETKPAFKKGEKNPVAIVQISTEDKVYLFRVSRSGLSDNLIKLFESKEIMKFGVAIEDDLKDLRRMRSFTPKSFFGMEKIVKSIGIESNGLKKLVAIILDKKISKSAQVSNWEADELTEKQITYAATDAWVCLKMYLKIQKEDIVLK